MYLMMWNVPPTISAACFRQTAWNFGSEDKQHCWPQPESNMLAFLLNKELRPSLNSNRWSENMLKTWHSGFLYIFDHCVTPLWRNYFALLYIIYIRDTASSNRADVPSNPTALQRGGSRKLAPGNHGLASSSLQTLRNPSREATSSGFGSLEVTTWQRPHFVHSAFVDLEGRRHPAATGTLLTPPAEGAQLRRAFRTQKLQEKPDDPV